jgi:hypothetical protein
MRGSFSQVRPEGVHEKNPAENSHTEKTCKQKEKSSLKAKYIDDFDMNPVKHEKTTG